MFERGANLYRERRAVAVRLLLAGQPAIDAEVYCLGDERLSDLLNDQRAFIPVSTPEGDMMVSKSHVVSLVELDAAPEPEREEKAEPEQSTKFDPYAILRIDPSASAEEIRAAYRARIKAVHPDAIASIGLDEDFAKAAHRATQRLNYAYQKIVRERGDNEARETCDA
ncbi:MAG: J domain-containing protein [Pseudomonadota bacterium]